MNRKWLAVGCAAALVAAALAVVVGRSIGRNVGAAPEHAAQVAVTRFHDARSGISISYPAKWTRLAARDPEVRLLAAADASTLLLVRVSPSPVPGLVVTQKTLPQVRGFTDRLARADARVKLLEPGQAVTLGGLPGYRYRYVYASGGGSGAHVHYFLFKGAKMIALVLQTMPAERLNDVSREFDGIAATFRGG